MCYRCNKGLLGKLRPEIVFTIEDILARSEQHRFIMEVNQLMAINKEINLIAMAALCGDGIPTSRLIEVRNQLAELVKNRWDRDMKKNQGTVH